MATKKIFKTKKSLWGKFKWLVAQRRVWSIITKAIGGVLLYVNQVWLGGLFLAVAVYLDGRSLAKPKK